jgi:hypothetical protein
MKDGTASFKSGDRVLIKREWDGDGTPHVIVEWNEDRGFVSPAEWTSGAIVPKELVTAEMIETAE